MEGYIESTFSFEKDGKNYLQINFAGCNFNCPWCNTPNLLDTKEEFLIVLREIKKEIKSQSATLEGVVFSGGEPCLQRQALLNLAQYAKDFDLKVILHTNASKPGCIRSLMQLGLLDKIILDIKASFEDSEFEKVTRSKTFFIRSSEIISDIQESIKLLRRNDDKVEIEIVTTIIPGLIFRKEDLLNIAHEIEALDCTWTLKRFEPGNTLSRSFMNIKPPSHTFLQDLKDSIQKKYYHIRMNTSD